MAKYDWDALKRKFITSGKCTLKQFAEDNKIPYGLLRDNAKGWIKEKQTKNRQKTDKIIDKTIEKQIDVEVDWNIRQLQAGARLLEAIEKASEMDNLCKWLDGWGKEHKLNAPLPSKIKSLAQSLEVVQKVQRIATGQDKDGGNVKTDIIKDFMEAVVNGNDNPSE